MCRALEEVHRSPGVPWSVETLARRAGLLRSRFFARFTELTGEAPMLYVTRWRMVSVAARMLRSGDLRLRVYGAVHARLHLVCIGLHAESAHPVISGRSSLVRPLLASRPTDGRDTGRVSTCRRARSIT